MFLLQDRVYSMELTGGVPRDVEIFSALGGFMCSNMASLNNGPIVIGML
jgi:hypothetical protein